MTCCDGIDVGTCYDWRDEYCCDGWGNTCPIDKTCCDGDCCGGASPKCCDDIGGIEDGYCCNTNQGCCKGNCCEPDENCCNSTCYDPCALNCCDNLTLYDPSTDKCCNDGLGNTCPKDETCCNGTCCRCDCIGGECLGWILETGEIMLFDNCYCSGGNCGGEGHTVQYHSCKRPSSGGTKECVYELNQPVGLDMDCVDVGNPCGILACYLLNAGVCYLQCSAAVSACTTCPGSAECSEALISCYGCLTGEGIDCGCLTMDCVPTTVGAGTHYEGDNILQGGSCP